MKFNKNVRISRFIAFLGGAVLLGATVSRIQAAPLVITESADFGDALGSPTVISPVLQLGTNIIQGAVDASSFTLDEDYFRITVPAGSRLARLTVAVSNFSASGGGIGFFDVLPSEAGNSGSTVFATNVITAVSFVIGTPTNIILHTEAPFAAIGGISYYDYSIELIVAPIEPVAGTAIRKAVEVTFPSEAGRYYQLQCTSDLSSDAWINVGTPVLGQGETMSAFDSMSDTGQRFYRVLKL